ncbi:hypothetical protein O1611_g6129 [Lasiodiplodia mahajangana]|uniref:Uncharacterized protein n=1 Tax=Lasiodiplodia mahajangana TaxID=1108764 RepID=A0ACC2JJX7_9PEZI|nr:hypothetical protein O1611_g6129 [Lasiodiplodia mahajangana]
MAWRYEIDREETLVAQELATSSIYKSVIHGKRWARGIARSKLTGAIVVGVKEGEKGADGKDVVVLRQGGPHLVGGIGGCRGGGIRRMISRQGGKGREEQQEAEGRRVLYAICKEPSCTT